MFIYIEKQLPGALALMKTFCKCTTRSGQHEQKPVVVKVRSHLLSFGEFHAQHPVSLRGIYIVALGLQTLPCTFHICDLFAHGILAVKCLKCYNESLKVPLW